MTEEDDRLTPKLVAIGMNFAADPALEEPDIEETLVEASVVAMEQSDYRLLAVLVTWFGVHHAAVDASKLTAMVADHPSARVRALWSALATWQAADTRLRPLATCYSGERIELDVGTDFLIARHGEDPRFLASALRLPKSTLRDRPADVLSREQLAARHSEYRRRTDGERP